jgi:hypothetical protein
MSFGLAYLVRLPKIKLSFLNSNLMAATDHLPIFNCDSVDRYVVGGFMATRTRLARASVSILLAAGILAAAQGSGDAQEAGKVGPTLQTVKTFGDDFRLVGIGVSAKGRVFATAPSSNVRSRFSMVEVDPKTDSATPYPDAAWNNFSERGDGKSEWISVQALWVDKSDHLWALDSPLSKVDQERLPPKLVEFNLSTNRVIRQYDFKGVVSAKDSLNDVRVDTVHDYGYLTNAGNKGSLVVLDLKTGKPGRCWSAIAPLSPILASI